MQTKLLSVLVINSSARQTDSVTRRFTEEMLAELEHRHQFINVQLRDVSVGLPFVNETWVNANFTPEADRTDKHREILAVSDKLVEELKQADVVLIAVPVYNFGIPATLKAWIDLIARVGVTFNYSASGPVGALLNKKAYLVVASGGTQIGSEIDFASGYLRHVLGFVGISDVSIISAEQFNDGSEQATLLIRKRISQLAEHAA